MPAARLQKSDGKVKFLGPHIWPFNEIPVAKQYIFIELFSMANCAD